MLRNTAKTAVLLAALGGLIITVAGVLGGGSTASLAIGLAIALVMVGGSYWFSDRLALASAHAKIVTEQEAPQLYGLIRSLTQRAGLPMPRIALSPSPQPNAFATGRNPNHAVVCATQGLLDSMPYDELEGVMAHELMHVKHRDILIGSVAAAIAMAISFLANMALWGAMFGGRGRDDERANPIALIAAAVLAPIAAQLIQMAVSRSREFDADRGAAELIGTGRPLASALQRIEGLAARNPMQINPAQASAWIHNPLSEAPKPKQGANFAKLFSTHPPTSERIARLLAM
jgi:heat shock protein HtpX